MIVKKFLDHKTVLSETCGDLREVLREGEYPNLDLSIVMDIQPTKGHFHQLSDEIYFVMDGQITLNLFEPTTQQKTQLILEANELLVIPKGVHHRITAASRNNRLCVITIPRWKSEDEYLSDQVGQ